jgi:hypothetical protein
LVGDTLGVGGGYGDHAQFDLPIGNDFRQAIKLANFDILDMRADLFGVGFEGSDDAEALLHEPPVTQEGSSQVSYTDEGHPPFAVGPEDDLDRTDEFLATVANAGMAKVPEMGQILTNLGIGEAQVPAKLTAAGGLFAISDQVLKLSQVKAQAADDRLGNSAGIGSW